MSLMPVEVEMPRRPRLLVEAMRHALPRYERERVLPRVLECRIGGTGAWQLSDLLAIERDHEALRSAGSPLYSAERHVEALVALVAERERLVHADRPREYLCRSAASDPGLLTGESRNGSSRPPAGRRGSSATACPTRSSTASWRRSIRAPT